MACVIERASRAGTRYVGVYRAANGKYKSAGTYDSHERAYEVAEDEERHARGFLEETSTVTSSTASMRTTSGPPSLLARSNAPLSPAFAPVSAGMT